VIFEHPQAVTKLVNFERFKLRFTAGCGTESRTPPSLSPICVVCLSLHELCQQSEQCVTRSFLLSCRVQVSKRVFRGFLQLYGKANELRSETYAETFYLLSTLCVSSSVRHDALRNLVLSWFAGSLP
jgi:hypothetical protein